MKRVKRQLFANFIPAYVRKDVDSMLVLGCGTYKHENHIKADKILAVDWADGSLHIAKEKAIVLKYDISELCHILVDKSFDIVVMFDVLEHLEKSVALKLLKDLECH